MSLPRDRDAEVEYKRLSVGFATELLDEATEAAHRALRRRITLGDILQARDIVYARRAPRGVLSQAVLLLSGALLGTGIQGLLTEYSGEQRGEWLLIHALVTVLGAVVGAIGVARR